MEQKQTRNFLIRNILIEVYILLEKVAKKHYRSKAQEALVAFIQGLFLDNQKIKKPTPFKWKQKITSKFIQEAIDEGRK